MTLYQVLKMDLPTQQNYYLLASEKAKQFHATHFTIPSYCIV